MKNLARMFAAVAVMFALTTVPSCSAEAGGVGDVVKSITGKLGEVTGLIGKVKEKVAGLSGDAKTKAEEQIKGFEDEAKSITDKAKGFDLKDLTKLADAKGMLTKATDLFANVKKMLDGMK